MIARLLARFRRKPLVSPNHPSVGLIRTPRNIEPISDTELRVIRADDARRRAAAERMLKRALGERDVTW